MFMSESMQRMIDKIVLKYSRLNIFIINNELLSESQLLPYYLPK